MPSLTYNLIQAAGKRSNNVLTDECLFDLMRQNELTMNYMLPDPPRCPLFISIPYTNPQIPEACRPKL